MTYLAIVDYWKIQYQSTFQKFTFKISWVEMAFEEAKNAHR